MARLGIAGVRRVRPEEELSVVEHLDELRRRIVIAIGSLVALESGRSLLTLGGVVVTALAHVIWNRLQRGIRIIAGGLASRPRSP